MSASYYVCTVYGCTNLSKDGVGIHLKDASGKVRWFCGPCWNALSRDGYRDISDGDVLRLVKRLVAVHREGRRSPDA